MSKKVVIKPGELNYLDLKKICMGQVKLSLARTAKKRIDAAHQTVKSLMKSGKTVYGINTGFALLANKRISQKDLEKLQRNLVLSHAVGLGEYLSDDIVRLCMAIKINSLARGYSGVSYKLIQRLIKLYNEGIYPLIPEKGSLGASGDLCPLAHLSLAVIGEGQVRYQGKIISCKTVLKKCGLAPLKLGPKEGLALLNGMQVSTAITIKALLQAESLFEGALISGALSVEAAQASHESFDDRILQVRGHVSQIECAKAYRALLINSDINKAHKHCGKVQDPYSLRCQPQVMGACLEQIKRVSQSLLIEANAVSDNPLVFSEQEQILSGGNFHGECVAMDADLLALAISEMGALSERRIALLIDSHFSGLPSFLVANPGLNSGFMISHYTATACASENKALSHPHSVDSLPTAANQEDHVSMAANAARRLLPMIENTASILGIELLCAAQGIEFRRPLKTSNKLEKVHGFIRQHIAAYQHDRYLAPEVEKIKLLVLNGEIQSTVYG